MGSTGELLQKLQEGRGDEALRGLYALDGSDASLEKGRERAVRVVRAFEAEFGARPEAALFSGPGRTEIGGNHTDHQHGRVSVSYTHLIPAWGWSRRRAIWGRSCDS